MEVVVSPSGKYIAAAMDPHTYHWERIKAWRFTNGQYIPVEFPNFTSSTKSVIYLSDEGAMACSEWFGVMLTNLGTGEPFCFPNMSQIECGLAVTAYGHKLKIIDTEKAELVTSFLTLPSNLDSCYCRFLMDPEDELKEFLARNGAITCE
jgi:hypothetical protein